MNKVNETIWNKIFARPSVPAALYMACVLVLTYVTVSYIPVLIISSVIIFIMCRQHNFSRQYMLFVVLIIISAVLLSMRIIVRMEAYETTGRFDGNAFVLAAEHKMNGRSVYTVRLDSGAAAVINAGEDEPFVEPGSTVNISGRIKVPSKATNPGEFDYREYLMHKGIRYSIIAEDTAVVNSSFVSQLSGMADRALFKLRYAIYELMTSDLDEDSSGIITALYLGDTSLIPDRLTSNLNLTSCSHLIAVSGTHFSGFMAFLLIVLDILDKKGRCRWLVVAFCLAAAVITGFRDSVTRALVMSICMVFLRDRLSGLCISLLIMMISDPFAVMQSGLQMSMAACFGILYWGPGISKALVLHGCPDKAAKTLSGAVCAHIGLLPFAGNAQMRISVTNLLCQIAGGLLVSVICIFFIPLLLLSLSGSVFGSVILDFLSDIFAGLIGTGAELSQGAVNCGRVSPYLFAGVFMFALIQGFPQGMIRKVLFMPLMALAAFCTGMIIVSIAVRPDLEMLFIDVGQGDCCLLISEGSAVLIDGGTYEEGRTVMSVLDWYGIVKVDAAVVTHWDRDHCGGISYLYRSGRIGKVYSACGCIFAPEDECFIDHTETIMAGSIVSLSDRASLKVIWPYLVTDGKNEDSIVMMLECKTVKCLFTGDIGSDTETVLVSSGFVDDCDILKVSHHGSRFSTSSGFIRCVSPETAVISCGYGNPYGHPSPETLQRLALNGVAVRRTDEEGTVRFEI